MIQYLYLGRVPYDEALLLQKELRRLRWENAVLRFDAAFEGRKYDEALAGC